MKLCKYEINNVFIPRNVPSWHNSNISFLICNTSYYTVRENCKKDVISSCEKLIWDSSLQLIRRNYIDQLETNNRHI